MIQNIPIEITLGSFTIIGAMTAYIWNNQGKKIDGIIKIQEARPCNSICGKIGQIQNDIDWIKKEMEKKPW